MSVETSNVFHELRKPNIQIQKGEIIVDMGHKFKKLQVLSWNPPFWREFTPSKINVIQKQIQNNKLIEWKNKGHCTHILGICITAFTCTFTSTLSATHKQLFHSQLKYLERSFWWKQHANICLDELMHLEIHIWLLSINPKTQSKEGKHICLLNHIKTGALHST